MNSTTITLHDEDGTKCAVEKISNLRTEDNLLNPTQSNQILCHPTIVLTDLFIYPGVDTSLVAETRYDMLVVQAPSVYAVDGYL
jgi:hypothetical protein